MRIDPPQAPRRYAAVGRNLRSVLQQDLQRVGPQTVRLLQEATVRLGKVDTRRYLEGWRARVGGTTLTVANEADHASFVERGRRRGRMPPVAVISAWAARKLGDARLGWPIARAIARRGIRPTRIGTARDMRRRVRALVHAVFRDALARALRRG